MGQSTRVEVEFDDHLYSALKDESQRLSIGVEEIVVRATSAWIYEMADNDASRPTTQKPGGASS